MAHKKILVIDDEQDLLNILSYALKKAAFQVYTALDGQTGLEQFYQHDPDLIILDLMMPGMNGWQVYERIRPLSDVPVLILTAFNRDDQVIRGLELGAADYIIKPIAPKVLVARVRKILKLMPHRTEPILNTCYEDDYLKIDLHRHRVYVQAEAVKLTATEWRLLAYLVKHSDSILTFSQILDEVWGWTHADRPEYVHVYVSQLRKKLEPNPKVPQYLITEHGIGYRFEKKF